MQHTCEPIGGDGDTCIPGCSPKGQQCDELGIAFGGTDGATCSYASLAASMRQQPRPANRNNEVVLKPHSVVANLPGAILAFFYTPGSGPNEKARVRDVHRQFMATFHLEPGTGPPVLTLDLINGGSPPFALADL